jgi:outer membrane immunogenic protein
MKPALLSSVATAVIASALGFSAPGQARAADWTGFYLGLNAGGAWGRSSADTSADCSPTSAPPLGTGYFCTSSVGAANATAVNAAGTGTINASGFTGGVQAGYNWQTQNLVYGLETDFGAFHLNGSRQGSGTYPVGVAVNAGNPFTVTSSFNTDWLFTLRGRLGWAVMPNMLAYATGGLAMTRLAVDNSFTDTNTMTIPAGHASENGHASAVKTGWALGGGLEWMVNSHWTVKGEYLYVDFGKVTATGYISNDAVIPGYAQGLSTSSDLTAQVARVGVNYKF